jgi:hypothetical protein
MGVDLWDAYNMNIKYADVTSRDDKGSSAFKAGFDVVTWGVGKAATQLGMIGYSVGLSTLQASGDILDYFFGPQIYQNINYNQMQSQVTPQSRQQAVQKCNSTFNLSTGGGGKAPSSSSLWVTPSGAVVTFGGQLVASSPSKTQ